jgi:hypothetical protein
MRTWSFVLLVALSFTPATPAAAQRRWQEIGKTATGNTVYLDPKSVTTDKGIVTATVRGVMAKPYKFPQGLVTASRTVVMFDCAKRMAAVKENIYYIDEKSNKVAQRVAPGIPGFATIFKGSLPDVALQHVCAAPAKR